MLRMGLDSSSSSFCSGIPLASQCATPKTVYELVAFADLLKPMPNSPVGINSPFEFASFGFLQHEFRPATRCERTLARVSNRQGRQNCPHCKQNRIHDCCGEIAPTARFKHGTRRFTERPRIPSWPRPYPPSHSHKWSIPTASRQDIVKK